MRDWKNNLMSRAKFELVKQNLIKIEQRVANATLGFPRRTVLKTLLEASITFQHIRPREHT